LYKRMETARSWLKTAIKDSSSHGVRETIGRIYFFRVSSKVIATKSATRKQFKFVYGDACLTKCDVA